jgi:hypothetical protein
MKHVLNGVQVTPRNIFEVGLNSDWTGRPKELEIDTDRLKLPREALQVIHDWINQYGPFQGIPHQIITNDGQALDYYVDLNEKPIFRDFEVEVTIKKRGGHDNFFDNADGTSFELMNSQGWTFTKIDIPYVIVKDNAIELALTLGVSLYVITRELIDQIVALSEAITQIIDAVTPQTGTGVTFAIGQIATLTIKALLQLAIVALILLALIKMSEQFFELLFPKIRYFQGTKVKHLIERGCNYLGYTLESNLLNDLEKLTVLPVPLVKNKDSFWDFLENDLNFAFTKGYPTASDSTPTVGALIRAVENQFNAKARVRNGVVQIERRDFWQSITPNQVIPALNIQDKRQGAYTFNIEDIWKRTYIHYQVDSSDLHTLDFFDPTDAEYSTEPMLIANADLVNIKGYNDINIPFALGVRKNDLNWLEKIAKAFFEVVDEVVNAFGGNGNFTGQITDRIGVLQISQQFYSRTKMMWTVNGKQPEDYADSIKASAIYTKYHKINEITVNDYKVFSDVPVRMTSDDFVNLLDNNFATIDGLLCEILTIQFFEDQSKAFISYKSPFNYADGKVIIKTINS